MAICKSVMVGVTAILFSGSAQAQDIPIDVNARIALGFDSEAQQPVDEARFARSLTPSASVKVETRTVAAVVVETDDEAAEAEAAEAALARRGDSLKPVNGRRCNTVDSGTVEQLIAAYAADEEIDAQLVKAVASVESSMGSDVGPSSAGALGVMMLMPDTATELGVTDICDAEQNISAGVRYLKQLQTEFGDPLLTLAAYNAGPGAVRSKQGIPDYPETTAYVAKVMNRWQLSQKVAQVAPRPAAKKGNSLTVSKREGLISNDENQWQDGHVLDFE